MSAADNMPSCFPAAETVSPAEAVGAGAVIQGAAAATTASERRKDTTPAPITMCCPPPPAWLSKVASLLLMQCSIAAATSEGPGDAAEALGFAYKTIHVSGSSHPYYKLMVAVLMVKNPAARPQTESPLDLPYSYLGTGYLGEIFKKSETFFALK